MTHCPCHICELERALKKLERAVAGQWMAPDYRRAVRARLVQIMDRTRKP